MSSTIRTIRLCSFVLFIVAAFVFFGRVKLAAAPFGNCEDVCDGSSDCNLECLYDLDSEETCADWGSCGYYACSDTCTLDTPCDTPCDPGNETNCGEYSGGESMNGCYTCGDGHCSQGDMDNCCYSDCGSPIAACDGGGCAECRPGDDESCGSGNICDANACCVAIDSCAPLYGGCSTSSDCCDPSDVCMEIYAESDAALCYPPPHAPTQKPAAQSEKR